MAGVVQSLVKLFDINHIIGTAYHPQSQSAVERPHREYNKICKTFMEEYRDWDLVVSIFVWSIRTSTKIHNSMYSPYEIITGLKPRSPIDAVLSMSATPQAISHDKYVTELVRYLKEVHRSVDEQRARLSEERDKAKLRQLGVGQTLSVGDYCLVRRPPTPGVSVRLQRPNFDELYQVVEVHGDGLDAKAYTVSDLRGNREGLGFTQPVAADRLTPMDVLPLMTPSENALTRILLNIGGEDRAGTVVNQSIDGRVAIRMDHDGSESCYDLSTAKYKWIS